jgi:hypothetical protein
MRLLLLLFILGCHEHPRNSYDVYMEGINPMLSGSDYKCDISKWGILNCKVQVSK